MAVEDNGPTVGANGISASSNGTAAAASETSADCIFDSGSVARFLFATPIFALSALKELMGMKCLVPVFLCLLFASARAQDSASSYQIKDSSSYFIINKIDITGNNKTKDNIILREVPFAAGDTLSAVDFKKKLVLAKQQVVNTSLFIDVVVAADTTSVNHVNISISVKERWYLLPIPYFRLVDRNFNQWWTEQHHSLSRVNYGLKLIQNNVSGQNDNAYLWLITGYNHQVAARYDIPFIDKSLHHGISVAASFLRQRELNYATSTDNKQLFFDGDDYVRQQFRIEASYLYRPAIRTRHTFTARLVDDKLSDTILKLNPEYFPYSRTHITYPVISYTMQYSDADNIVYPTKGLVGDVSFVKKGFGKVMNLWQLGYHAKYTIPLSNKTGLQLQSASIINLPFKQPFFNKQIINYYGDVFFRGLEYYVIDGVAATVNRATLRQQVFTYNFRNPVNIKNHDIIPVRFFLKAYGDAGYVYNDKDETRLNNHIIGTYGLGLDIVTIYDIVIRLEYSFNQWGQNNLYLHSKGDF